MRCVGGDEDGVAVRSRAHDGLRRRNAAAAADVLDDHGLTERLRHAVAKQSGERIGRASCQDWAAEFVAPAWVGVFAPGSTGGGGNNGGGGDHCPGFRNEFPLWF